MILLDNEYLRCFSGTLAECEEYCQGDGSLNIDDSTWMNTATRTQQPAGDNPSSSSDVQGKKRNPSTRGKNSSNKRPKTSNARQDSGSNQVHNGQDAQLHQRTNERATVSNQREQIPIARASDVRADDANTRPTTSDNPPSTSRQEVNRAASSVDLSRTPLTNQQQVSFVHQFVTQHSCNRSVT